MDFIVMDDVQKVGPLKRDHICPYCGERTVLKLGPLWSDNEDKNNGNEFILYFCKNKKCRMRDKLFNIPKSIYDK